MNEHELVLLTGLKNIRDNGPADDTYGLCYLLERECEEYRYYDLLRTIRSRLFQRWPKFSGDKVYPIPGGEATFDAYFDTNRNMWDKGTEYGRLRWDLLHWMINELEKEVK